MAAPGYLFVDHRASPGLSRSFCERRGFDHRHYGEGKVFEADFLLCVHCGTPVILRPERVRKRERCFHCFQYACDACFQGMNEPGYEHHTFEEIKEKVLSGLWEVAPGSTPHRVFLRPTGKLIL